MLCRGVPVAREVHAFLTWTGRRGAPMVTTLANKLFIESFLAIACSDVCGDGGVVSYAYTLLLGMH